MPVLVGWPPAPRPEDADVVAALAVPLVTEDSFLSLSYVRHLSWIWRNVIGSGNRRSWVKSSRSVMAHMTRSTRVSSKVNESMSAKRASSRILLTMMEEA